MQFNIPQSSNSPIKVIGVGGGGSNAVNTMFEQGITGVDFIVCNTDAQALDISPVPRKVQLGATLTGGQGAGSLPEVGKNAAIESLDEVTGLLGSDTSMVFVTAGMGGGTGTGAAPVIAQACKERGILTVGIVTVPFMFEGRRRNQQASEGLEAMRAAVDTLLIIRNDKLRELFGNQTIRSAFANADQILCTAAKGIAEVITLTGEINVDMNDVNTVMRDSGRAIMGSGCASGQGRAQKAVSDALESPLLNDSDITGANFVLLNITFGTEEILMDEIMEITDHIQEAAGQTAEVIWGYGTDPNLGEDLCVTVIATGFDAATPGAPAKAAGPKKLWLDDQVSATPAQEATTAPEAEAEPFLKPEDAPVAEVDRNKWDLNVPQRELFPTPEPSTSADIPSTEAQADLPQETLNHEEATEAIAPELHRETPETPKEADVSTNEEFIIYNLDDVPEPQDLTPEETNTNVPVEPETSQFRVSEEPTAETSKAPTPSVQPSREAFAERQRQITRSLAEFKSKLNLPGRIADLENEPAYKRRNISIEDTPQSADSQVSRMHLSEEVDEEGNRRVELRNDNPFLHDNVD
ncbi:MAG TPA: cell division protein FtsZ [Flavobacteriales bacterium]|nr:cell division protein FtsZ [Flavobacteriales bacterium]